MRPEVDVELREVGLRDGLQSIATIMPTKTKQEWIDRETACGVAEIEVCSFVPAKLLPQFHDAAEVVSHALRSPGLKVSALIPNLKGAERAIAAGVHKVNYAMSASEAHNQANVRRSRQGSMADLRHIVERLHDLPPEERPQICGGIATSFGCTIEGAVDEGTVLALVDEMVAIGVDEVVIADTVGYANPAAVSRLFSQAIGTAGAVPVAAHFHDTRGLGLANVVAALDVGIRRFDASLGGLGGCPYAPGATGNITMEDLTFMLEAMGLRTGVDARVLVELRRFIEGALPGEAFAGAIAVAGLPKNYAPASHRLREEAR